MITALVASKAVALVIRPKERRSAISTGQIHSTIVLATITAEIAHYPRLRRDLFPSSGSQSRGLIKDPLHVEETQWILA